MAHRTDLTDPADLVARFGDRISIGAGCEIPTDTIIEIGAGGFLAFGDRVALRRGVVIEVSAGATAIFGNDVTLGENVVIFVMVGLKVGDGCGISNMVDIHDHNHRERSLSHVDTAEWTTYASGFAAAPVVLESGCVLSNKCTVTAGTRVGHNTIVGANSVVSRSLPPNVVAAGAPAVVLRGFDGRPPAEDDRHEITLGFFGTSIMEHLEGYAARMSQQWNLPAVGSTVTVEGWRPRGYVHRLYLRLQAAHPHLRFGVRNHGLGGANSRAVLSAVRAAVDRGERFDLVFFGCGINDVWRAFQNRPDEAVPLAEYRANCASALHLLRPAARRVVVLAETPFGFPDAAGMNAELRRYAEAARAVAAEAGAAFVDPYPALAQAARTMRCPPEDTPQAPSIWGDGVHLSELGDTLMVEVIHRYLADARVLIDLERYERLERRDALERYRALCDWWRLAARARTGGDHGGQEVVRVTRGG